MRPRECAPPRECTGVSHACGSLCCFFCMESSLPSQSGKFLALLQVPAPALPLWWTLSLLARNPTPCVLPNSFRHTASHSLLLYTLIRLWTFFVKTIIFYPSLLLAVFLQVWSWDQVHWHPLHSLDADAWAPPVPTEAEPLGMGPRCPLCVPKFEKHQLATHSSPYWMGEWRKGKRKQREGRARCERGNKGWSGGHSESGVKRLLPYFSLHQAMNSKNLCWDIHIS